MLIYKSKDNVTVYDPKTGKSELLPANVYGEYIRENDTEILLRLISYRAGEFIEIPKLSFKTCFLLSW